MDFERILFLGGLLGYVFSFLAHAWAVANPIGGLYRIGRTACWIGTFLGTLGLGYRWWLTGYPPLSNMYESLYTLATFFAWASLLFTRGAPFPLIEGSAAVMAILMTGTASVFKTEGVRPLIPALQSYWLHLHVSLAFLGEACFALAFILSYLYCLRRLIVGPAGGLPMAASAETRRDGERGWCLLVSAGIPLLLLGLLGISLRGLWGDPEGGRKFHELLWLVFVPAVVGMVFGVALLLFHRARLTQVIDHWMPDLARLDDLSHRAICVGYPLFTVGAIIFGMVWANKAWGRYWGWDPKETWALITFLVYSGYLHARLTKGWQGTPTAVLSVLGFLFTLFTLFGVNLLWSGLHSYGT